MKDLNTLERRPAAIFISAPQVEDVANDYGITDPTILGYMYEVYKRTAGIKDVNEIDQESYDAGYEDGYNAAIEDAVDKLESAAWDIGNLKK